MDELRPAARADVAARALLGVDRAVPLARGDLVLDPGEAAADLEYQA